MRSGMTGIHVAAGVILGFLIGVLLVSDQSGSRAWAEGLNAQPDGSILIVPLQVTRETQGFVMVDTANETLWVYELFNRKPGYQQIRLVAARSWKYDRQLTEWNCGEPTPGQIREVLEGLQKPKTNQETEPEVRNDAEESISDPSGTIKINLGDLIK